MTAITPKTIFVTGCAGFIGANFVQTFAKQYPNTAIVGIDDFSSGRREKITGLKALSDAGRLTFYEGSITDPALLAQIFTTHKPEYVFHFAAIPGVPYSIINPARTSLVNVYGTSLLIELARDHGVRRFIFSSSSSVYGGAKILPTKESENPPKPLSPYAIQKYTGEMLLRAAGQLYGIETVSLRYFNVYGPGQFGNSPYPTAVAAWLEALYFPQPERKPFLEGDGTQTRDLCFVDNVVAANICAMNATGPLHGEAINIAHGERNNLNDILALLQEYTGRTLTLERRPPRPGDIKDSHADITLARELIGYEPKVKFKEGLKRTVAWFEGRLESEKGEK